MISGARSRRAGQNVGQDYVEAFLSAGFHTSGPGGEALRMVESRVFQRVFHSHGINVRPDARKTHQRAGDAENACSWPEFEKALSSLKRP